MLTLMHSWCKQCGYILSSFPPQQRCQAIMAVTSELMIGNWEQNRMGRDFKLLKNIERTSAYYAVQRRRDVVLKML